MCKCVKLWSWLQIEQKDRVEGFEVTFKENMTWMQPLFRRPKDPKKYTITRLAAHFMWNDVWSGDLQKKNYGHTWHRMSLLSPGVIKPPHNTNPCYLLFGLNFKYLLSEKQFLLISALPLFIQINTSPTSTPT